MVDIVLLDLDASGIDLEQPCPPDFMQFVYENSQDGHLTLWSHVLSEPGGPARIQKWFDDGLAEYHSRTIQIQMAPPTPNPPSGENISEITYPEGSTSPPVNVDAPYVAGSGTIGGILNCTMGNWQGVPTSYAYAWARDGVATGDTGQTYDVVAGDAGHAITCVVTATNNAGSTDSPPSNAVTISAEARTQSRREYPKEER